MKRKVVKQGKSTLMISLPSKWVKDNNINRGDEIDLQIDAIKLQKDSYFHNKFLETTQINNTNLNKKKFEKL